MSAPVIRSVTKIPGTSSVNVQVERKTGEVVTLRVPGKDLLKPQLHRAKKPA